MNQIEQMSQSELMSLKKNEPVMVEGKESKVVFVNFSEAGPYQGDQIQVRYTEDETDYTYTYIRHLN